MSKNVSLLSAYEYTVHFFMIKHAVVVYVYINSKLTTEYVFILNKYSARIYFYMFVHVFILNWILRHALCY